MKLSLKLWCFWIWKRIAARAGGAVWMEMTLSSAALCGCSGLGWWVGPRVNDVLLRAEGNYLRSARSDE